MISNFGIPSTLYPIIRYLESVILSPCQYPAPSIFPLSGLSISYFLLPLSYFLFPIFYFPFPISPFPHHIARFSILPLSCKDSYGMTLRRGFILKSTISLPLMLQLYISALRIDDFEFRNSIYQLSVIRSSGIWYLINWYPSVLPALSTKHPSAIWPPSLLFSFS